MHFRTTLLQATGTQRENQWTKREMGRHKREGKGEVLAEKKKEAI